MLAASTYKPTDAAQGAQLLVSAPPRGLEWEDFKLQALTRYGNLG